MSDLLSTLMDLTKLYPTEEIRITMRGGDLKIGIPTGELGDAMERAVARYTGYIVGREGSPS